MSRLAQQFETLVDVVPVDLYADRRLAWQMGVTVCPSYVLFDGSRIAATRSFPTSADLLGSDVESLLSPNAPQ